MNEEQYMQLFYDDFTKAYEWALEHRYVCFPMEREIYRMDDVLTNAVIDTLLEHYNISKDDAIRFLQDECEDINEEQEEVLSTFEEMGVYLKPGSEGEKAELLLDYSKVDGFEMNGWLEEAGYSVEFFGESGSMEGDVGVYFVPNDGEDLVFLPVQAL